MRKHLTTALLVLVSLLLVAVIVQAIRGGALSKEVARWEAKADTSQARTAQLLAERQGFNEGQGRLTRALADSGQLLAAERSESERLWGVLVRIRQGTVPRPAPTDTSLATWIQHANGLTAQVTTLTDLAQQEGSRADRQGRLTFVADSGRLAALDRLEVITRQLKEADSLLTTRPRVRPMRLGLLLAARARTGRTGEVLVGLQSGDWHAAGFLNQDRELGVELGGRKALRIW